MRFCFRNETDYKLELDTVEILEKAAAKTLSYEGFSEDWEIGLTIVNGEEIRKLNNKFRGIDRETDVLSFPLVDFKREQPADGLLGDIVINIERAKEQSEEYGHSLMRELGFLTVHSMLHLLGYDHMTEEEEKEMFGRQKIILDKMGLKR